MLVEPLKVFFPPILDLAMHKRPVLVLGNFNSKVIHFQENIILW
jgi:hypothetical protein